MTLAAFVLSLATATGLPTLAQTPEVIAEIRIHGNLATPDDEMLRLAGVSAGDPFGPGTIDEVTRRLDDAGRFRDVQVLKRFASIEDTSRVLLVIVVDEGPVRIEDNGEDAARVVKRSWLSSLMWFPLLDAQDGYGVSFGVRIAVPDVVGDRSRLSFPLTWGGRRQAGVELDRVFASGPLTRATGGMSIVRSRNPAYQQIEIRRTAWARAERALGPVRAGAGASFATVSFAGEDDDVGTIDVDVVLDTRLDPALPRNAVYAAAGWALQAVASRVTAHRLRLEGRGYVGLLGQSVLMIRAERHDSTEPLPPYLKSMLGGWSNLRGYRAGAFVGDTVVSGSLELTIPLSSPLRTGRFGVNTFVDAGTAYDKGMTFDQQPIHVGAGAGVWLTATIIRVGFSVAHGRDGDTRANFAVGLTF